MSHNTQGILWGLVAIAMFAIVDAMAKIAVTDYHVLQILFFRQIVVFASCLPTIVKSFPESLKTSFPGLHAVRLAGAFTALACGIWAVALLPLSTATTLGFAQTLFVAILAALVLRESVGKHRIATVVLGFIGVVVVLRPGVDGLINVAAIVPLLGAFGAAFAVISVRKLSQTDSTATLLVYQAVFVGVLAGIPMFWFWKSPDFHDTVFLLSMGVVATVGQWVGVKALRLGEASVVGNVKYVSLLYAVTLGYFIFGEVPDRYTLIGAAIIIFSAVLLLRYESR